MKNHITVLTVFVLASVVLYRCSDPGIADTAPKVLSVVPADGSDSVEVVTDIGIHFDQAMDTLSCMENFNLYAGYHSSYQEGNPGGHYHWDNDGARMQFSPDDSLEHDMDYTICLRRGMMGHNGHMMMASDQMEDNIYYHFRTR